MKVLTNIRVSREAIHQRTLGVTSRGRALNFSPKQSLIFTTKSGSSLPSDDMLSLTFNFSDRVLFCTASLYVAEDQIKYHAEEGQPASFHSLFQNTAEFLCC